MSGLSSSSRLTLAMSLTSTRFHSRQSRQRKNNAAFSVSLNFSLSYYTFHFLRYFLSLRGRQSHVTHSPAPSTSTSYSLPCHQGNHVAFSGPTTSVSHHDRPVVSPPTTPPPSPPRYIRGVHVYRSLRVLAKYIKGRSICL